MLHALPRSRLPRATVFLVASLLLVEGGCAIPEVANHYPPPDVSFSDTGQLETPDRWWNVFGSPALDWQVERALGGNVTLAASLQRLRAARAVVRREASDLLPDVDGLIDFQSTLGPGPNRTSTLWGLDAAYQVDLWGQIQSRVQAEEFRAEATHADYHAVALTLSAEVARTWFALIEAHAQLELIDEQVDTNETGLVVQELRFGRGFVRSADVLRQRQLVEATREQAVIVRSRIELLEHQLAVLQGELPQAASYITGAELPELPPLPWTGLPSELLLRRPDVQRDYLASVAAERDMASAVSAQYPRISLTASLINASENSESFFRDWFLSLGGQLIAPLIDGGQRRAEVERTAAVASERLREYEQTTLVAFSEVEDYLALERNQIQRIERLDAQVVLAEQASGQLREQYLIGDANYLDVLSAIQSQQRLQRDVLSARLDLILIRIGLYMALAGGFDPHPQEFIDLPADLPTYGIRPLPPPVEFGPEIDADLNDVRTAPPPPRP